ncbi:MAG: FHA domain-containing protein [Deferribacteres bacterium]|nr:FHA domain-containing protein [candidate division KSB1 bacterium]MCB9501436.1 FHA domain-containing protein [Deferribacteres bacterium]
MPKLIVKHKAEVIEEINIKAAVNIFDIGRDDQNDLVINDKLVSGSHLRIERQGNQYIVRDLKSAFGTFLNGNRVEKNENLSSGDEIRIGDHIIVFDNPLEHLDRAFTSFKLDDTSLENEMKDPVIETESLQTQQAEFNIEQLEKDIVSTTEAPPSIKKETSTIMAPFYLLAIWGPYSGKKFQLKYGETRIGRDSKLNDIIIRENKKGEVDPSISRRHATISYIENKFHLNDKRSKTRTYVNQKLISENDDVVLNVGDEIEIVSDQKSTIFRFTSENEWDFSTPKKAGVWWVRNKMKFMSVAAGITMLAGLSLAGYGYMKRAILTQKPDTLIVEATKWRSLENNTTSNRILSESEEISQNTSTHALADFDGDGFVDIAALNISNNPILLDGKSKRVIWTISSFKADPELPVVVVDINNNDMPDLLYVSNNGQIIAVDGKLGAEIWMSPYFNGPFSGRPIASDFNGDGAMDVAIVQRDGRLHIGLNQIRTFNWVEADLQIETFAPLSAADIDLDGDSEILCGTERGLAIIVDGTSGSVLGVIDINDELNKARGTFYEENQIRYPVGVADLTGDHRPDLVISSVQGNIVAIDGASRSRLWESRLISDITLNSDFPFPFSIADLTGNGKADVVVTTANGEIQAFIGSGQNQREQKIWTAQAGAVNLANNAYADINKDRITDIIFRNDTGSLVVINGTDGHVLWTNTNKLKEQTDSPFIADLQRDNYLDIVLLTNTNHVFQFRTNSKIPEGTVLWGQQFGGYENVLQSAFTLPSPTNATIMLSIGIFLFVAAIASIIFMRKSLS